MAEKKFFICKYCGNVIEMIHSSGVSVVCCGEEMTEIVANTVDAAREKHLPVIASSGNTVIVKVGSVPHPMTKEHLIEWIYLETEQGIQRKHLKAEDIPEAEFLLSDGDKAVAAYAYCNLHGLWMTKL